jgi:hypothetical protein
MRDLALQASGALAIFVAIESVPTLLVDDQRAA